MDLNLAELVSALGVIIAAYLSYNQYTRNKITDLKVDQFKRESEKRSYNRSQNCATVYGEIWRVLYEMKADRVYIMQPHPLGHPAFLSIQFEVKEKGISGICEQVQNLPMSAIPGFAKTLADNKFLYINDVNEGVDDDIMKSMLASNGCESVVIRKLCGSNDWVGSVFCEYTDGMSISENDANEILQELAINIQYLIPEVRNAKI